MAKDVAGRLKVIEGNQERADSFVGQDRPKLAPAATLGKVAGHKKHVTYYLERDMIRRVKEAAVREDVRPAHIVERALTAFLDK